MFKPRLIVKKIEPYYDSPEAIIITGMRRTGKTTLLNHIYDYINTGNKLLLDLENPLNRRYFEEDNYERIKSSLELLRIDFNHKAFIFLDEIQLVKNIPSVVKYFIDHYKVKFFLTGSASFYMKHLFTESLAGRKYIFELFPLSFREFLEFKESPWRIPDGVSTVTQAVHESISLLYDEYVSFGGFPGVVLKTNIEEKERALNEIFTSFYQLEILQLGDFRKNKVIRDLMLLLAQRIGSKLDIQKVSRELGISRPTLYEYLAFLESVFFIKMIRPFSRGKNTEIRKMPKIYLCDSGLVNQLARLDPGLLFENSIFQNLRQKGQVNYYERKNGAEIDFILNKDFAYETKLTGHSSDIRRLKKISHELNMKGCYLIVRNYCELENTIFGYMV